MKDRKLLGHTELVNEVIKQLATRFHPKPSAIKQAIERMIEKEYLERDEHDRKQLKYMVSSRCLDGSAQQLTFPSLSLARSGVV